MSPDRAGDVLGIAGALVLVGSALIVRRRQMPRGRFAVMALVWIAIFVAAFAVAHMLDHRG
jgi:drug/metabolite transporter (DMT)-like permease